MGDSSCPLNVNRVRFCSFLKKQIQIYFYLQLQMNVLPIDLNNMLQKLIRVHLNHMQLMLIRYILIQFPAFVVQFTEHFWFTFKVV